MYYLDSSSRAIGAAIGFPRSLVFLCAREVEGGEEYYSVYEYVYSAKVTSGRWDTVKCHGPRGPRMKRRT